MVISIKPHFQYWRGNIFIPSMFLWRQMHWSIWILIHYMVWALSWPSKCIIMYSFATHTVFSGWDTLCSGGICPLVSPFDSGQKSARIKITWTKFLLKYKQKLEELVLPYTDILWKEGYLLTRSTIWGDLFLQRCVMTHTALKSWFWKHWKESFAIQQSFFKKYIEENTATH